MRLNSRTPIGIGDPYGGNSGITYWYTVYDCARQMRNRSRACLDAVGHSCFGLSLRPSHTIPILTLLILFLIRIPSRPIRLLYFSRLHLSICNELKEQVPFRFRTWSRTISAVIRITPLRVSLTVIFVSFHFFKGEG